MIVKNCVNLEIFTYSIDQANTIFAIKYYQKLEKKTRKRIVTHLLNY